MPTGHVKWYDLKGGEGIIEHAGRDHPVRDEDIDKHARVPGAPVEFDIQREGSRSEGYVERAVNVTLREGTRVSHRQERFGDLTGAKYSDSKHPRRNRPEHDAKAPPRDDTPKG